MTIRRLLPLLCVLACDGGSAGEGDEAAARGTAERPAPPAAASPAPSASGASQTPDELTAFFGDLHVHTRNSFDAYVFNVRATPDDAYRFAKGEAIRHPLGYELRADRPLDFLAVTDHGEYLGVLPAMDDPSSDLSALPLAEQLFSRDPERNRAAFLRLGATVASGTPLPDLDRADVRDATWAAIVRAAEEHDEPGRFTTFAGYEYTSAYRGANLHRNVIFADEAPPTIYSSHESQNPEDLWDWLDRQREAGFDAISIPHNSNASNGLMFRLETFDGSPLTASYAEQRALNEPLVEVTQVKGTSETHPTLSPNDEWAGFEVWNHLIAQPALSSPRHGYARGALADGIALRQTEGFNPYRFGLIGSSDSHVGAGPYDEDRYWSKVGVVDGAPFLRGSVPPEGAPGWGGVVPAQPVRTGYSRFGASGLAGVWATRNTRADLFAAMKRKETFATSGPRITVRMMAGRGAPGDEARTLLAADPAPGLVPMGGEVVGGKGPMRLEIIAGRDPEGAPLDRVQVVKLWSEDGAPREAVIDVACAFGRTPDPRTRRCPPSGASVDLASCAYAPTEGGGVLRASWTDPDFDEDRHAAYYVRVLQTPTCRWSSWDALRAGTPPNPDLPPVIQERAWSSPVWYAPA